MSRMLKKKERQKWLRVVERLITVALTMILSLIFVIAGLSISTLFECAIVILVVAIIITSILAYDSKKEKKEGSKK